MTENPDYLKDAWKYYEYGQAYNNSLVPNQYVMVNTNPLLQELLNCLLDNADKYATGGSVLMSCHANADGTYAISVSNEGPVIPASDAERIFDPFVRLSPDEHSLGIGLPLACLTLNPVDTKFNVK